MNTNKNDREEISCKIQCPIWEKANLTISEAVIYFNIGENTLRAILDKPDSTFVLNVGKKKLIKRKEFEKWLQNQSQIK